MYFGKKLLSYVGVGLVSVFLAAGVAFAQSGTVKATDVCLRSIPSTEGKVLDVLSKGTKLEVEDKSGKWYKVTVGSQKGWIYSSLVRVSGSSSSVSSLNSRPTVKGSNVNLRRSPTTTSRVVGTYNNGTVLTILDRKTNWIKVKVEDGKVGWIYKTLVREPSTSRGDVSRETEDNETYAGSAEGIVSTAKDYLGVRYSWGGDGPYSFDCSGYVKYVFKKHGINLLRTAASQAGQGVRVSKSRLRSGDLVFFHTSDSGREYINHVGIYIGDGNFIHASSGGNRVMISNLSEGFYKKAYVGARRVLN